jgi:alpha-L-rhamnosidase
VVYALPAYGYVNWVSIGSNTPKDVIATAYFANSTRLVSKIAATLGKDNEARKYEELFEQIKDAFNKTYVTTDDRIKDETQSCYLLCLYFDLLSEDKREPATRHYKRSQNIFLRWFLNTTTLLRIIYC